MLRRDQVCVLLHILWLAPGQSPMGVLLRRRGWGRSERFLGQCSQGIRHCQLNRAAKIQRLCLDDLLTHSRIVSVVRGYELAGAHTLGRSEHDLAE